MLLNLVQDPGADTETGFICRYVGGKEGVLREKWSGRERLEDVAASGGETVRASGLRNLTASGSEFTVGKPTRKMNKTLKGQSMRIISLEKIV